MKVFSVSLLGALAVLFACSFSSPLNFEGTGTKPISHVGFDSLLKKHVSAQGNVNYKGFQKVFLTLSLGKKRKNLILFLITGRVMFP